jgi:peptidoglycan/xylan/chitin deacetylase (PgdA/CDA1 family)
MNRLGVGLAALLAAIGTPAGGQPSCPPQLPACTLASDGTASPGIANGCANGSAPDPVTGCPAPGFLYDGHGLPPKVLSLTYDDGPSRPSPAATLELATYLRSMGIRATFFAVTGPHTGIAPSDPWGPPCPGNDAWGQSFNPDIPDLSVLHDIEQLGHRIGNHTHNHFPLDDRIHDQIVSEVCTAQALLDPYVPDGIFLLRPPYGGWTQTDADLIRSTASLNKVAGPVIWTYWFADWTCAWNGGTPEACGQQLLDQLGPNAGGVILFHDWILNGNPDCPRNTCCAPNFQSRWAIRHALYVIEALKQRGYLILPLDADPAFPGGMLFGAPTPWETTYFGDSGGWGDIVGYYGTFRLGDVNGDGKMDVCARGCCGIVCSLSHGDHFDPPTGWQGLFSNANGWLPPERSTTIQLGDVNNDGKDDLCALDVDGVICVLSNGSSFGNRQLWLPRASLPSELYSDPGYYGTIRLAKVVGGNKGKDLCFRAAAGMMCAINQGSSFAAPTVWSSTFSDLNGWLPARYSGTTQLADINGDGLADVCVRGRDGIFCGLSNGAGSFEPVRIWSVGTNFSDLEFWPADLSTRYTETFRLADVDGDGRADACIRSSAGFLCAQSLGDSFDVYRVWQKKDFRDDQGWSLDKYAATVMLGDVTGDGRADVCVRGPAGIVCAPSNWCTGCTKYTGTLAGTGTAQYQPDATGYITSVAGTHVAAMSGPSATDFDLELEKWNGLIWTQVVASPGPTSPEHITYTGTAGTYRWRIVSKIGSGPYSFWLKHP